VVGLRGSLAWRVRVPSVPLIIVDNCMYELDAIAIGTGPSFYEWLNTPRPENVKFYGSGVSSKYIKLDVYTIGDSCHIQNIPRYEAVTYGTHMMLSHSDKMLPYDGDTYPHGGSSGGMAISLACLHHDRIGLVGYDGPCGILDLDMKWIKNTIDVLEFWIDRGKKIVSLMPHSCFNEVLNEKMSG